MTSAGTATSVRPEQSGLASGLVNTSYQVGSALGLAAMTAVAAAVSDGAGAASLNDGYQAPFIGAAAIAAAAAVVRRPPAPATATAAEDEAVELELAA